MSNQHFLKRSDFTGNFEDWEVVKASAAFIVKANGEEMVSGDSPEFYEATTSITASEKAPYGDVHYCDDGMRSDGKKRFPVNTAERVRAAWSYSHHKSIMAHYTSEQLQRLHSCIAAAWRKLISKDGPPSADGK